MQNADRHTVMELRQENDGGLRRIIVTGEADLTTSEALGGALTAAAESGACVHLDLRECGFIDSATLAMMLRAIKILHARDKPKLRVVAGGQAYRVLTLSAFDTIIELTEAAAAQEGTECTS